MPGETNDRRWIALAVLVAAQFMVVLDVAIVNVALPSIQTDLHFSEQSLQWVITAYAIMFGGFLLLGGRMADLLGRRRLFIAGVALFTVSSLLAGFAWSAGSLITFRATQGLGGALLAPAALSILTTTFAEGRERNVALGVWGAVSGTSGLMLLVYAMTRATEVGWGSAETIGVLAASAALILTFVAIELRSKAPLLPMRIFRLRSLTGANVTSFLVGTALFSQFFLGTLYMQQVLHYSAMKTGVAYLPLTLTIIALAGVAQK